MNTIDQDMKDSIAKNLPAQVGEVLQKRLLQAENDTRTITELNGKIVKLDEKITKLIVENDVLNKRVSSQKVLDDREKSVYDREYRLELELLKKDVTCAQLVSSKMEATIATVFKNPVYQESHFSNVPLLTNGYITQHPSSDNVTKTVGV